jgi:hypothetical protein
MGELSPSSLVLAWRYPAATISHKKASACVHGSRRRAAWPSGESPTAKLMNALPKLVFSSSRSDATWNNTRITATPVQEKMPAVLYMSMSLDGYCAGPCDSLENPFGDGGERLHDWLRDGHGVVGRPPGVNVRVVDESSLRRGLDRLHRGG